MKDGKKSGVSCLPWTLSLERKAAATAGRMSGGSCPTGVVSGLTPQMGTWGDQGSAGPPLSLPTMGKGWSRPAVCSETFF